MTEMVWYLMDWRACYSEGTSSPNTPYPVLDENGAQIPLEEATREQIAKYMPHYLATYDSEHPGTQR